MNGVTMIQAQQQTIRVLLCSFENFLNNIFQCCSLCNRDNIFFEFFVFSPDESISWVNFNDGYKNMSNRVKTTLNKYIRYKSDKTWK